MDTKKFRKQSGFNNDRDSYVSDEGDIVYLGWEQVGGQWKRRELARVKYADLEASGQTEIVFAIDESHREMDLQKDHDERNADKVIARQQAGETGDDDTDFVEDPIEQIADPHGDIFDLLFSEDEEPENPQIEIVRRVIESLPEKEQEMFWARYGEMKFLEDILYNHPAYAYYKDRYAGGNNPPDCGSFDGVTGIGTPGGSCSTCPYNRFGSGEGKSKLCKNKRLLYILQEGELFPIMLSLPTGSLVTFTKYVKSQLSKGRKLNQIVTKITLKKATNASGIAFSQAVFAFDRALSPVECKAVGGVAEQVRSYASNLNPANMAALDDDMPFVDAETGEVIEPLK